jgi:aryl carrier-like protein
VSDTYTRSIPIGKPIDNTQMYVLDKNGQVQPIGVDGELYIGGIGVARGYLNKPELTSERFVRIPHLNSGYLYKTGDIVSWLENGELSFKGRQDAQVKIKGVRIELEEIEATIKREKRVKHAKVLAAKNEEGNDELHAFVVNDPSLDKKSLDLFLSMELPYYAIPTTIIMIDSLPFTQNGKVDTKALLSMLQQQRNFSKSTGVLIPQNETEKMILSIWQQVLRKEDIGLSDNFFHVGGDSIKILKVFNQLKKHFVQPFQVVDLFQYTTISSLSHFFTSKSKALSTEENDDASFDDLVASTKSLLIEND